MNSRLVSFIVLSLSLTVFSQVQTQNLLGRLFRCGQNEIFSNGAACVETCTTKPEICPLIYKIGCVCQDGYVRQSDAENSPCIKREECQLASDTQTCGENEEYSTCGTACPDTCDDLRYPLPKPPKACILLCRQGCFCKAGYYRSDDGKCVRPEQCCRVNERYKTCGSACVETCDGTTSTFCTTQCVIGCFCGCSDYVRANNSTGSACIHRDDCPKNCDDNNE